MIWMLIVLSVFGVRASAQAMPAPGMASLIGIDHMPTVVSDLEKAADTYRQIGFALKPGRPHENGIQNRHVKFKDGSGIELLSVPAVPTDALTRAYRDLLREGEGPAYLAFHARDTERFLSALSAAGLGFENRHGLVSLKDEHLQFIFFIKDNRSPTDMPEHFAHANSAAAMSEVWLAVDAPTLTRLKALFGALGAESRTEMVNVPDRTQATVFYVQNGRVIVVQESKQLIRGRLIIGAAFPGVKRASIVAPRDAHGLWLQFLVQP